MKTCIRLGMLMMVSCNAPPTRLAPCNAGWSTATFAGTAFLTCILGAGVSWIYKSYYPGVDAAETNPFSMSDTELTLQGKLSETNTLFKAWYDAQEHNKTVQADSAADKATKDAAKKVEDDTKTDAEANPATKSILELYNKLASVKK